MNHLALRKLLRSICSPSILIFCALLHIAGPAAQVHTENASSTKMLPYAFTNFVWWTDPDLRADLKKRIPGLGDEIAASSETEAKMRTVLSQILRQKGIGAEVQTQEPSCFESTAARDPLAPPAAILFSILAPPEILIADVSVEGCPPSVLSDELQAASILKGKRYDANTLWADKKRMKESLEQFGYLSSALDIHAGLPASEGDRYMVPLQVVIQSGPQYHVSSIRADGGPLLKDRDLSPYFGFKAGDLATPSAFGKLAGALRAIYWHAGYTDVDFRSAPILDQAHALAAYDLQVIPGPIYHLRSLKIENLDPARQAVVRGILGFKQGDIYDAYAVVSLQQKLQLAGNNMTGYGLTYSPKEDQQNHLIELTLTFYKEQ